VDQLLSDDHQQPGHSRLQRHWYKEQQTNRVIHMTRTHTAHVHHRTHTGSDIGDKLLLAEHPIDFAISDAPLSDLEVAALKSPILHLPITLTALEFVYNLPTDQIRHQPPFSLFISSLFIYLFLSILTVHDTTHDTTRRTTRHAHMMYRRAAVRSI
jgi:hypothetical protein